jgi:ABC-2 type transport system ATP-binding protein
LDPKARLELRNLLLSLRDNGATILISSHILTELEGFCTSIGLMEKGRMVRSGAIGTITSAETRNRVVRVRWLNNPATSVESLLNNRPNISGIIVKDTEAVFSFGGADDQLAAILAGLVSNRIEVVFFGEVKQTIEDLYMKISTHGVT